MAIVTKDRTNDLSKLLTSLVGQLSRNKEVRLMVVDNSPTNSGGAVYQQFQDKFFKSEYLVEQREGAVFARNAALRKCQTEFIAFIDDDCVVEKKWLKEVLRININPKDKVVFWQGISQLANKDSAWAEAQCRQAAFSYQECQSNPGLLQFHMDTKNLILHALTLKQENIYFDERYGFLKSCGFEDVDLGMQLYNKGYRGMLLTSLVVSHREPTSGIEVFRKYFNRGQISVVGEQKWLYRQLFKHYWSVFGDWRLVFRSLRRRTWEQRVFWCSELMGLFYYCGYCYEQAVHRHREAMVKRAILVD